MERTQLSQVEETNNLLLAFLTNAERLLSLTPEKTENSAVYDVKKRIGRLTNFLSEVTTVISSQDKISELEDEVSELKDVLESRERELEQVCQNQLQSVCVFKNMTCSL